MNVPADHERGCAVPEGFHEERIERIEEQLKLPAYRPPALADQAPGVLTVVVRADRSTAATWTAVPDRPELTYEVHEFLTDPAHTLKATVPGTARTSTPLKGGWYEWAVRGKAPDGTLTGFSPRVRVFVGDQPPAPLTANPVDLIPILRGWTLMRPTGPPRSRTTATRPAPSRTCSTSATARSGSGRRPPGSPRRARTTRGASPGR